MSDFVNIFNQTVQQSEPPCLCIIAYTVTGQDSGQNTGCCCNAAAGQAVKSAAQSQFATLPTGYDGLQCGSIYSVGFDTQIVPPCVQGFPGGNCTVIGPFAPQVQQGASLYSPEYTGIAIAPCSVISSWTGTTIRVYGPFYKFCLQWTLSNPGQPTMTIYESYGPIADVSGPGYLDIYPPVVPNDGGSISVTSISCGACPGNP